MHELQWLCFTIKYAVLVMNITIQNKILVLVVLAFVVLVMVTVNVHVVQKEPYSKIIKVLESVLKVNVTMKS